MKTEKITKEERPEETGIAVDRRSFIKTSVLTFGAFTIVPRYVLGRGFTAPSDKVNLGFIGLGKQSRGLASRFTRNMNCQIVAGSDVWTTKNKWFRELVQELYSEHRDQDHYNGVKTYLEYKELLADPGIDAVVIATPDHWHALQAIDAMESGKDVFCEKPLTHTIAEGKAMVKTADKTGRIVQTGSMQRSWENFRRACELVRNGYLGEITKVLVSVGNPSRGYDLPTEALPEEVNWNKWCGPAPLLGYNHRLSPSSNDVDFWPDWRDFREYGGGGVCDWGAHMFDIAQWALGMDKSGPVTFIPPKDPQASRGLKMIYGNGIEMVHEEFDRGWGVRFIGSEGKMDISRNYFETTPESLVKMPLKPQDESLYKVSCAI